MEGFSDKVGFIWSVADLLRGDYKAHEYGRVILPLTVLRRLDATLAPTKAAVLAKDAALERQGLQNRAKVLERVAGVPFYNTSPLDFRRLLDDPENIARNLATYVAGFSPGAADVLVKYGFAEQTKRLNDARLLYPVVAKFADLDVSPETVSNVAMGYVFEELIRRFSEASNETAGEHFTPREVIRLMVNLLLHEDDAILQRPGSVRTLYDPACGTGGMLTVAEQYVREHNPDARLEVFGQELNPETWAICRSDMLLTGHDPSHIVLGNSFSNDGLADEKFDYMLANPPFGVEWKKVKDEVETEFETLGFKGRFGAGLPRINDGSFLFLQHMISKMKPVEQGGSRLAIVFNGSPLFTGAAGSGESEIRRWILENDWLEGIVALPEQLFYNTGISTYFWVLSNRKSPERKGKVALIDAREMYVKMRKSLGNKRREITNEQIDTITNLYTDALALAAEDHPQVKVFNTTDFGYQRITVERALRLRFEVSEDTIAAFTESKAYRALGVPAKGAGDPVAALQLAERQQGAVVDVLRSLLGTTTANAKEMTDLLNKALVSAGMTNDAKVDKAIRDAIALPDPEGQLQTDRKGEPLPDPDLRDNENVPLGDDITDYIKREVLPHVPEAWVDEDKTKIGYEIPFTRHFYVYRAPRPLADIEADIRAIEDEIQRLLSESMK
ncbi:MAG: type restriction-modification system DNA-methyltransferase subunit [Frankiales bacterium]|nr:type restriction-modification system DNA-methyltransferase subunit [Frankiales bacterium]